MMGEILSVMIAFLFKNARNRGKGNDGDDKACCFDSLQGLKSWSETQSGKFQAAADQRSDIKQDEELMVNHVEWMCPGR